MDLDTIISQITTSTSPVQFINFLRSIPNDTREVLLASTLSSGQDPLSVLDVRNNTLGVLYILSARVTVPGAALPPWPFIEEFCNKFDQLQVRYAPDRFMVLGRNIPRLAAAYNDPAAAIFPLRAMIQRYIDPSYLTALHSTFILTCVATRRFTEALPILEKPLTNVDVADISYTDNLVYHYAGGLTFAALNRWNDAEDFFEICVTSPGVTCSAIQLEALKKMRLVQLISKGKVSALPKYVLPNLSRLFKNSPIYNFTNSYPHNMEALRDILKKERSTLQAEKNLGLINLAIDRAPRWALKKLTGTYVTLNLAEIARAVKIDSIDAVRDMLLNMVESGEISAQISADGSVTFSDPPPQFTKVEVDQILKEVQEQSTLLAKLDLDMGKNKEFLAKAVKLRSDVDWMGTDELMADMGISQSWGDDPVFS